MFLINLDGGTATGGSIQPPDTITGGTATGGTV